MLAVPQAQGNMSDMEVQSAHIAAVLGNCDEQLAYITEQLSRADLSDEARAHFTTVAAEVDSQRAALRAGSTRLAANAALGVEVEVPADEPSPAPDTRVQSASCNYADAPNSCDGDSVPKVTVDAACSA